ncbi:MAG: ATP-binding protein [Anaerovoracaceae bacterium]
MKEYNRQKLKQTVQIAVFVSLGSLLQLDILVEGFIVGFSVVVFAIFVYSYVQLSPMYIAIMSGIFSPALRMSILWYQLGDLSEAFFLALPDTMFFFSYGAVFSILKKVILDDVGKRNKFLYGAVISDFCGNVVELIARSVIMDQMLFSVSTVLSIAAIALGRTVIIWVILIAMEANGTLIAREEHDEEYRKLTVMASEMCNELYIMQKNIVEIENLMKNAYTLTKEMEEIDVPRSLRNRSLEIAKDAHEIKGDYVRAINSMREEFVEEYEQPEISMSDVASIVKTDVMQFIKKNCPNVSYYSRVRKDFFIKEHFEMVSIIRNLIYNSLEAIIDTDDKNGYYVFLNVYLEEDNYIVTVSDNGPGIPEDIIDSIFLSKFSTKYSSETGNMYRGIGLLIVRDYIEKQFHGTISVTSKVKEKTEFKIKIPVNQDFGEEVNKNDEILFN